MARRVSPGDRSYSSDEQGTLIERKEANTFALPPGTSNYETPADFRAALDAVYNFDDWDPCPINSEGIRTYDGLGRTPKWVRKYFYNPPYNNVVPWLKNSIRDWENGILSCALVKADTSTSWMHDLVFPYARVIWVRGRLKFSSKGPAPFNSAAAVYEPGKLRPKQSVMWKDRAGAWHILFDGAESNRPW